MRSVATTLRTPAAPWGRVTVGAPPAPASEPDQRWDLLLACVAGYLLTAVGRVHQLFPLLGAVRPTIVNGILAIGLYLLDRRPERRFDRVWVATTKCLLALLGWTILSIPGALVAGNSFDLVFNSFVKTVLLFLVTAGAVRGLRDVERLAAVYLVGAAAYAAVACTAFDLGSGSNWRLGHLFYYDANDLAAFLVTAVPFGIFFLQAARRAWSRLLAAGALLLLMVAFVRTGSRGGFIALLAVAAYVVLRYSAIPLGRRLGATVLVAVVVAATASDQYWQQMGTIGSDTDYNRTEESGRMQIWRRGIGYMLQHAMLGVGPDNFRAAEGTLSPFADRQQFGVGVRWNAAHNAFIQVGAELGVPGLVLFVAMIVSAFVALRRSQAPGRAAGPADRQTQLAQVLTASLIGFVVGAFFLSLAYSEMLYTLLAMAVGLKKTAAEPDTAPGGTQASRQRRAFPYRSAQEA
jgi:O-antigen ligase